MSRETRTYMTTRGVPLTIKRVPVLVVERILNDTAGKPEPPMIQVNYGGKHQGVEPNPHDPYYQEQLERWNTEHNIQVMTKLFKRAVAEDPPPEFVEENREDFPEYTPAQMKYLWIADLMGDDVNAIDELTNIIVGNDSPVEEEVAQEMSNFPGEDQREGHGDL